MKPLTRVKYMLSTGLLLISASFIFSRFFAMPDFADGLLKGVGIGLIFLSMIRSRDIKSAGR